MKTPIAIIAACAAALVFVQADFAQAQTKPTKQTKATGQIIVINPNGDGKAAPRKPPAVRTVDTHELEEISFLNRKGAPGKKR
jgi:ABC-type enterochelin transport system substrate-binding protein